MDENRNKSFLKAAQIARARVLGAARGIKDAELAAQFGLSHGGFARLISTPEYKELELAVLTSVTSKQDAKLDGNLDLLTKQFQKNLPAVCQQILDIALQKRDLKAALAASKTWIELDPAKTLSANGSRANAGGPAIGALPDAVLDQLSTDSANVCDEVMGQPITESVQ